MTCAPSLQRNRWQSGPFAPIIGDAQMATKLEKTIKREIEMDGTAYMVTISPEGVKLTQKGFRKGREMSWRSLWQGGTEEGSGGMSG